ncbi:hypothetical protein [Caloranaerobacter sp. DY30410]|uniref:hypothetical protein n=1 Tax=Caloranaerobacter sp. DY30410 TaxID=3238305 RepID=UPI003D03DFCB
MNKEEKYIDFLVNSKLSSAIFTKIVSNETLALVLLDLLIKKGIITSDEYRKAIKAAQDRYIRDLLDGYIDKYGIPDKISFNSSSHNK